ncbi:MAG: 16S rRNA (guanine(527)-N(7))-methyltransferase RsmG [Deltaproteobacteria bacterium]|nr:16S rRNA (guanine(527)-N(7))-methyltransferase RsmG [Deltaproteobacteria bacterium]
MNITLGEREIRLFLKYLTELKEWNRRINLTSIKEDREIIIRHFLDSLTLSPFVETTTTRLDIGSGAGFPGIPLKIALPTLEVTLLDSSGKKVAFMRHITRALGLKGIKTVRGRAEDPHIQEGLGTFDVVTTRAFAGLKGFLEMAIPYTREGGLILAVKGPKGIEELKGLKGLKGFEFVKVHEVRLPFSNVHTLTLAFKRPTSRISS